MNENVAEEFNPNDPEPANLRVIDGGLAVEAPATGIRGLTADVLGTSKYRRFDEASDRSRRVAGKLFAWATVASALIYLAWYASVVSWHAWYISIPFLMAEISAVVSFALFAFIARHPRYHDPAGRRWAQKPPVDIFITSCGEPLDVLRPTIKATMNIEYENKMVYILDDSNRRSIRRLAESLGCRYLARKDAADAKAGNLNNALKLTTGDLILTLDADQIPDQKFLKVTVGYFEFQNIAFVQTAQRFKLPEGDPFGGSDDLFYQVMQPGKDRDNAAFSCGSGVIYRRSALTSISGFSTWNLVEDLHTSMRLHANGWRSIYHNHQLSTGLAPSDITSIYAQRGQWAVDSLRLLFWDSPFKYAGLTFRQKLQYFSIGFSYVQNAIFMPFFFILPSWALITGKFPITAPLATYAEYRGFYLLLSLMAASYLQHPKSSGKSFRMWVGLFPVHLVALFKALTHPRSKPKYKVNSKTPDRPSVFMMLKSLKWQLAIIMTTVFAISYRALDMSNRLLDLFMLSFAWGLFILWSLSWICYAALKPVKWPRSD